MCKSTGRPLPYALTRDGRCMQSIISIRDLKKIYASGFQALKSTNLEIRRGEIFGLVGADGAGKSSTVRMLCTLSRPSAGEARARAASSASTRMVRGVRVAVRERPAPVRRV